MNINDLLKEKAPNLDSFLTEEMYKLAGDHLMSKMMDFWETEQNSREWFYSNQRSLGNKRPYDYCLQGKKQEVEDFLGRLEHGVYM